MVYKPEMGLRFGCTTTTLCFCFTFFIVMQSHYTALYRGLEHGHQKVVLSLIEHWAPKFLRSNGEVCSPSASHSIILLLSCRICFALLLEFVILPVDLMHCGC